MFDGNGMPIPDALIEIRQSDTDGSIPTAPGSLRRDGFTFTGWGRAKTDRVGHYSFSTVTPGATRPGEAPFFAVCVFARGLLDRLLTRAYVPDHENLDEDAVLSGVDAGRRATLIAVPDDTGYRFDIHLQGDSETVFLQHWTS